MVLKKIFSPRFKKISSLLWIMWFALNFSFFGMLFILPVMLSKIEMTDGSKGTEGLDGLLVTIAGELPSAFVALYIIEK